ncbi:MAG: cyclic nucleotide-binding domain-containing protein [Oculatellaceae cyanobacterium Prado106]|jgi:bacteriocin-type transport-associated protein|nr:cyclic nucleotide-binding domain-containing protein [Oculatellaceae cyanobacterium Prado106]
MTAVLLKELSNSDIDWMLETGQCREIEAGDVLMHPRQPITALHLLLDGAMSVSIQQPNDNPLGRAFAALEGGSISGREIARLNSGEMIGELPFVETYLPSTTVTALQRSTILSIPQSQLAQKLQQDIPFAAHLYRACAVLLANRLEQIIQQVGQTTLVLSRPQLREILFIFAELHDSDIDWMVTVGQVMQVPAGNVLMQAGRPVDALHIVLSGRVALVSAEGDRNPLARAFSHLEKAEVIEQELAQLSRGDIVGESPFIEAQPPAVTVRALEDSCVLTIPRWRLAAKLLHDTRFAARFYRVLSVLLADKQQALVSRLGYGRLTYSTGQRLDEAMNYENELSPSFLEQVSLAGARFDWMLKQVRVK